MLPLLLACTPSPVQPALSPEAMPDPALDRAWLRAVADAEDWRLRMGADAMALAVLVDGRLRYAEGLGEIDGAPIEADAIFRWASVSKPHVAWAVHRLAEEGQLSVDDPLSSWFPAFEPSGPWADRSPTLDELMRHTSGLPDLLSWRCDPPAASDLPLSVAATFDGDWSPQLLAPPGAVHNYSNTNYTALGGVLELATGQPFVEAMASEVLSDLGMRTATYDVELAADLGALPGTGGADGQTTYQVEEWDCHTSRPPAWLHGSVLDLARFAEVLLRGDLPPSLVSGLADPTPTALWGSGGHRIGPGLYVIDYRDRHEMWSHDGWVTGFASYLAVLPDEGIGVVLVATHDAANTGGLRNQVLDHFLGLDDPPPAHDPALWPLAEQARWEGVYRQPLDTAPDDVLGDLTVWPSAADGVLALFLADDTPVPLLQLDGDQYGFTDTEGRLQWVRFVQSHDEVFMVHRDWVASRVGPVEELPGIGAPP